MVRAFTNGAMVRRIDPLWWTVVCAIVFGVVHIIHALAANRKE